MTIGSPEISQNYLETNLAALARRSPVLFERLRYHMGSDHVVLEHSASGNLTAKFALEQEIYLHSSSDPVREALDGLKQLPLAGNQSIVCIGLGLGYYLNALLAVANPCRPVLAYERDPWLLLLTLSLFDFSRDILAGRVEFLLGTDIFSFQDSLRKDLLIWPHPVLGSSYEEEQRLLQSGLPTIQASRRAMVVAGGLFVSDVVEALRENGILPLVWDAKNLSKEETIHQIHHFDPHMIFAINYCEGLPELCEALGLPVLIWEIDPTIERLPKGSKKEFNRTYIYTYRKSRTGHYIDAGFSKVEYLPLATNPKRRHPMALENNAMKRYGADVSFVGSSMAAESETLCRLCKQLADDVVPRQGEEYITRDDRGRLVDLAACLAEKAASERRGRILSLLASRNYDLRVWGDTGWRDILPDNARYCGLAGHSREITQIYNATKINLDINRIYQQDIVTMRIFDILACKGFVLADHGACLGELFQLDTEVIAYRSEAEIPALLDYFLANEQERNEIALAGYQRVLRDHTILGRVRDMLGSLP